jgi:hypothetical protein
MESDESDALRSRVQDTAEIDRRQTGRRRNQKKKQGRGLVELSKKAYH